MNEDGYEPRSAPTAMIMAAAAMEMPNDSAKAVPMRWVSPVLGCISIGLPSGVVSLATFARVMPVPRDTEIAPEPPNGYVPCVRSTDAGCRCADQFCRSARLDGHDGIEVGFERLGVGHWTEQGVTFGPVNL
jgi:hypothetical protein